jgi:CheY-like chemotaxis protein
MSAEPIRDHHILVVDDDPMVRSLLQAFLTALGHRVVVAENGLQAIDAFHRLRSSIRLLVTDLRMPVMDGVSLIRRIRQLDEQLPIAAITGYADDAMLQAIRPLVTVLIKKPVRFSELQSLPELMQGD